MFEEYKHYTENSLKQRPGEKIKTVGYITPTMGHYPRNRQMEDANPRSDV